MADDSVRRTSAPPEIPVEIWRRSGRPLRGQILRGAAAWTVASFGLFAPSVAVALGFAAAGVLVFFALPWWADRRLAAIGADLAGARPHEALERIRHVEERRVLGALVPHGWAYAQRALVLLRSGDGRGADKALSECARVGRANEDPRIVRLRIEALLRTNDTARIPELLEGLPSRGPTDTLAEAIVHLAKRATTRRAAELLDQIGADLGDSPRWLAASALACARSGDTAAAEARIDALSAHEDLEAEDSVAADLLRRARKALRDGTPRRGRRTRAGRQRRADDTQPSAERTPRGGKRRKKDRRKERRKRRKEARAKRRDARPAEAPAEAATHGAPAKATRAAQAKADGLASQKASRAPTATGGGDGAQAEATTHGTPAKATDAARAKADGLASQEASGAQAATGGGDRSAEASEAPTPKAGDAKPAKAGVDAPSKAAGAPLEATPEGAAEPATSPGRATPGASPAPPVQTPSPRPSAPTPAFRPPTFVPPPPPATVPHAVPKPPTAPSTASERPARRGPSSGAADGARPSAATGAPTIPPPPGVPPPPVVPPAAAGSSRPAGAGPAAGGLDAGWLDLVGDLDAPPVAPKAPHPADEEPGE